MSAGSWWRRLLEQGVPAKSVGDWPHDTRPIGYLEEDGLVHRTEHWPAAARQLSVLDELDGLREREWAWQYPELSASPRVTTQVSADESPLLPRPWTGRLPRHRGTFRIHRTALDPQAHPVYVFRNDVTGEELTCNRARMHAEMTGRWATANLEALEDHQREVLLARWAGGIHHV